MRPHRNSERTISSTDTNFVTVKFWIVCGKLHRNNEKWVVNYGNERTILRFTFFCPTVLVCARCTLIGRSFVIIIPHVMAGMLRTRFRQWNFPLRFSLSLSLHLENRFWRIRTVDFLGTDHRPFNWYEDVSPHHRITPIGFSSRMNNLQQAHSLSNYITKWIFDSIQYERSPNVRALPTNPDVNFM